MDFLQNPFIVPLGAFVMTVIIVAIAAMGKMRAKELQAHQELRLREMEHERKMKEYGYREGQARTGKEPDEQEFLKIG